MPIIMNMGIRTLRPQIPSGPEDRATGSQMTTALVHTVPKADRACNGYIPGVVHLTYLVQHARNRQNLISVLDSNIGSPL